MQREFIYHMCPRADWDAALANGVYPGGELDRRDGFIHFSSADQVVETAARYLAGVSGLVLLAVDPARLGDALKWEKSRDNLLFPHLYTTLSPNDVESAVELPLGPDGHHIFPQIE